MSRSNMRIGQEVRIKNLENYTYDPEIPSLKPGSSGYVTGVWAHPYRDGDTQYLVKLKDGFFPFFENEIEKLR